MFYSVASKFELVVAPQCLFYFYTLSKASRDLSTRFYTELQRHNYVTPTSYLELISTFKELLRKKRQEVNQMKKRYEVGLSKLMSAASQVTNLLQNYLYFMFKSLSL